MHKPLRAERELQLQELVNSFHGREYISGLYRRLYSADDVALPAEVLNSGMIQAILAVEFAHLARRLQ